jgi:hypothetical protein
MSGICVMKGLWPNCGQSPTIEAHLYPRALMHDIRAHHKHLYTGSATSPGRTIHQSGFIDKGILCSQCDRHLGKYDTFGIAFCRDFTTAHQQVDPKTFRIPSADTESVVKFFLSMLWRFSISTIPEAKKVALGPYQNTLRDILFLGALCSPEPAVTLLRYRSYKIPPENICYPPFKIHLAGQGLTGYSICLGGFRAFVKTDARPAPPSLVPFVINGRQDIVGGIFRLGEDCRIQKLS